MKRPMGEGDPRAQGSPTADRGVELLAIPPKPRAGQPVRAGWKCGGFSHNRRPRGWVGSRMNPPTHPGSHGRYPRECVGFSETGPSRCRPTAPPATNPAPLAILSRIGPAARPPLPAGLADRYRWILPRKEVAHV
jgi:hypothetical protein